MSEPYIGEIRIFGFGFAPKNWALCNGQLLSIAQNQALFSIMGTTYGGNGQTTFGLPNLQGRVPIHWGNNSQGSIAYGQVGGEVNHTLSINEMPQHFHGILASTGAAAQGSADSAYLPTFASGSQPYASASGNGAMGAGTIGNSGGSQPHPNMQPYVVTNICIALQGIFPSRS